MTLLEIEAELINDFIMKYKDTYPYDLKYSGGIVALGIDARIAAAIQIDLLILGDFK